MKLPRKDEQAVRGAGSASGRPAYVRRKPTEALLSRYLFRDPGNLWAWPAYRRRALRRRRRLWLGLAAAALLIVAAAVLWHETHLESVVVLAKREVPGSPVYFYQEDAAWSGETLGASDRTLGKDGDSVACLASLMAMQELRAPGIGDQNPGTLNAWLSENGVYDEKGRLIWHRVGELLDVAAVESRPRRNLGALIEQLLQDEVFPIVQVRLPDTGRAHDVLVVGSVHGEFVILDPLDPTDVPNTLGLYENRIYAIRYLK